MAIYRQQQIKQLDDFIQSSKEKLTSILSRLGWSVESVTNNVDNFVVCPFEKAHRVPEKSLDQHLQECQWKAEGYKKHDVPLSIPSLPSGAPSSVKFDEQLQEAVIRRAKETNPAMSIGVSGRLIPRTSDRLTAEFTREEKCAMYEYVIANTVEPDIGDDIADMNKPKSSNDAKSSSYLELLAQERNLKRRRAKYRGVHTNKKSQIEILRDVVNQQMEMLAEYVAERRNDASNDRTNDTFDKVSHTDEEATTKKRKSPSIENNDRYTKRSEPAINRGRSTDDPRYHRRHHDSRDFHSNKKRSVDVKKRSKERERIADKQRRDSGHERHRHRSKDRRERTSSRGERDNSRSHRESKYDERKWESSRRSRHDDRKSKKRRSRSR